MPRLEVDLGEAFDLGPIPPGRYPAQVAEVRELATASTGRQYLPVVFEVTEGEFRGRRLTRNYFLSGKSASFLRHLVEITTGEKLPLGEVADFDPDDMLGAEVIIEVSEEEYEGETRPQIRTVLPVGA